MNNPTPARSPLIDDLAARHGFSVEAVEVMVRAILAGGGNMAQFSHYEFGGMGQWSRGGMLMIGDMFNQHLKYRVDSLCSDIAELTSREPGLADIYLPRAGGFGGFAAWWPAEFGSPSSSGAQNDMRYAFFPDTRRLVIGKGGETAVYDTGDHMISGVSQQQGGDQTLSFSSQFGTVRLSDLKRLDGAVTEPKAAHFEPVAVMADVPVEEKPVVQAPERAPVKVPVQAAVAATGEDDIFSKIERLAGLRDKGIVTDEEFTAKKAELLSRL